MGVHAAGGPDVLIDVYPKGGLYAQPLPFIPCVEGAGIVEAVGPGVTSFQSGAHVAYARTASTSAAS
jgi:NADPH2:quinone reductase